ncbi:MAG TPA: Hsp20/alpha crystallin family protein [Bryobacteraceae bacterium]|nr:Hsp20/alpha crystallin family protein [Bryobacteraceae bacterium]
MFGRTMFDELNELRRSFDQVFGQLPVQGRRTGESGDRPEWSFTPAVETGWTDDYLNLRVVLPAVSQKDIKMTIQGNQLIIQGERRQPENFSKEGTFYNQMAYGRFERWSCQTGWIWTSCRPTCTTACSTSGCR